MFYFGVDLDDIMIILTIYPISPQQAISNILRRE